MTWKFCEKGIKGREGEKEEHTYCKSCVCGTGKATTNDRMERSQCQPRGTYLGAVREDQRGHDDRRGGGGSACCTRKGGGKKRTRVFCAEGVSEAVFSGVEDLVFQGEEEGRLD